MYWQLIGFGLNVGWLWLFFLSGPVFKAVLQLWPGSPEIFFLFFMLITSLTFLLAGKWAGYSSLLTKKRLLAASAVAMAAGPALLGLLPLSPVRFFANIPGIAYLLIAGGAGGGTVALLAWLESFFTISTKAFALSYAGGIVIASILLLGGTVLPTSIGLAMTVMIPFIMLPLIMRQAQTKLPPRDGLAVDGGESDFEKVTVVHGDVGQIAVGKTAKQPFPVKLILLMVLFYTAGGLMFNLVITRMAFANLFWISNLFYMFVVVLAGLTIYYSPDLDLRLLSRPVLPLLAAGFILVPFLSGNRLIISFLLIQAGFALFDMYTWLLVVYVARGYPQSLSVLGLGMFWITFSLFGGNLAFTVVAKLMPLNRPVDSLAVVAGLLTLLATFVFQDRKETFAGWETLRGELRQAPGEVTVAPENAITRPGDAEIPFATQPRQPEQLKQIASYHLTCRETEILLLILKGRNNPYIRENLNISPNTLKFHLRNIYQKLAVANRQELLSLFEDPHS